MSVKNSLNSNPGLSRLHKKNRWLFAEKYPDVILTEDDLAILQDLTYYELILAEQLNLDYYKSTLNSSY